MDLQPVLEGERLLLRPLVPDDWDALFAVASDRQLWALHPAHDRWQEPVFRAYFEKGLKAGGALTVIDKASGAVLGSSQFIAPEPTGTGSVEIGATYLARSHWGGATNREMKRLMLAHAFGFVQRVDFLIGEDNLRSRRAIEKIGARLSERSTMAEMVGGPVRHVIYEITRDSFASGPLSL